MKKLKTFGIWGLLLCASLFLAALLPIAAESPEAAMAFTWFPALGLVTIGRPLGEKIFDWAGAKDVHPDDLRGHIVDAFNHHIKKLNDSPPVVTGEKITGHDSNLMGPSPIVLAMSDTIKMPDRGYELLFGEVDMRQSTNDTFELLDISGGVTFFQQKAGEKVKLSKIPSSAKTQVGFLRFTGGFPILDDWLRFNKFYLIDDLAADTIKNWYDQKATIFYGLLTALTGIDQAFDTDDVTTINNACAQILEDLSAAGYAVDENSQFAITCNPKLRGRIFKALRASYVMPNTNNNEVLFNISAVISTTKIANTSYYVSLPGGKNKRGEWEDLNSRPPQRDEVMLGADHVWTGAYNGIIGEKKQHRKCALS